MQELVPLRFRPMQVARASETRQAALLRQFQQVLRDQGMASIEEYGDMLKWALPSQGDGWCRYFHAYDPSFCSFSDAFRGTIHDHGGTIRGTVLLGHMDHGTYKVTPDADGDRVYQGQRLHVTRHSTPQPMGTQYELPARVPHWPIPTQVTLTYFEEEDNGVMGDLLDPVDGVHDEQPWEQADAEAFRPKLEALVAARLAALSA